MRIFLVSIFLISLVLCFSPASAIEPDSVFIRSVGGQEALDSLNTFSSFRVEGSAALNDKTGTFVELFQAPDKFYLQLNLDGLTLTQAYDGNTAWQSDHNGRISELHGFEKKSLLTSIYIESFAYLIPGRMDGGYKFISDTTIMGSTYHNIALYPLHNDTIYVLFDVKTGNRKYLLSKIDNLSTITTFDDFRVVRGVRFPFKSQTTFEGVPLSTSLYAEKITFNVDIDSTIFRLPTQKVSDYRFGGTAHSVTLPFDYSYGHIWLTATINGKKKCRFILDSGASANMLHAPTVASLQLPSEGSLPAKGLTGYEEVQLVRYDSLSLGNLTLLNQVAGAMDLSMLSTNLKKGEVFGGILGYDFLSRFPVLIDYKDSTLTVFNPDSFQLPEGGTVVDFHLSMLIPVIKARIDSIPGDFIIDLGNPYGLLLHKRFVEEHNLLKVLDDIEDIPSRFGGISGTTGGKTGLATSFVMGGIRIDSLRVILPDSGPGLTGSEELDGNIGNLLLEHFKVLFDYKNSRIVLYN